MENKKSCEKQNISFHHGRGEMICLFGLFFGDEKIGMVSLFFVGSRSKMEVLSNTLSNKIMSSRKIEDRNIRKLTRMGRKGSSLGMTIPKELVEQLGWRERQKVIVKKSGNKLIVEDWKK